MFGPVEHGRLFQQQVTAGGQDVQGDRQVGVRRGDHDDRVGLGLAQHRGVVVEGGDPVDGRVGGGLDRPDVAQADQPHPAGLFQAVHGAPVPQAVPGGADDRDGGRHRHAGPSGNEYCAIEAGLSVTL